MPHPSTDNPLARVPTLDPSSHPSLAVTGTVPDGIDAVGVPVAAAGEVPEALGLGRDRLVAAGFDAAVGATLIVPGADGPTLVAVGIGDVDALDVTALRDAAAAFARAGSSSAELAFLLPPPGPPIDAAAQAVVEGVLLARYRYDALRTSPAGTVLAGLTVVAPNGEAAAAAGLERGRLEAGATMLARDLANAPHNHLTASDMAVVATAMAAEAGLGVEVFDKAALVELGCGGLLGVNAGSAEPPVMVKLTYRPPGEPTGRLALVGKGIMYDSGGIALKPGNAVHALMKNDMSGAGAVLASMSALGPLGCTTAVTGYLMCTDNMPSGTAMALGDVITMRGGTTVEVVNTDAEGRLVMADALVLGTEEPVDAIVDIATLTGACMRALGVEIAGVMGNHDGLVAQVRAAAEATDEPVWPLPLAPRYRKELDSTVADLKNLGGENAGAITAGLFLAEFVGDVPWAHIDMAGTAHSPRDSGWHQEGCTGFGARLLLELALDFTPPAR
jgi:leucyl aminopeptidase